MTIPSGSRDDNIDIQANKKKTDKIWCPEGGQYKYIEVCEASCKKKNKCKAYADYHEPKFI